MTLERQERHIEVITNAEQASQMAHDIFAKAVKFIVVNKPSVFADDNTIDNVIVLPESVFPFTTNEPVRPQDGYSWFSKMSIFGRHIALHISLTDDDRTNNKNEFKLIFCPVECSKNIKLKDIVDKMISYGFDHRDIKIAFIGPHWYEILTKRPEKVFEETQKHPELMRHFCLGDIETSMLSITKISEYFIDAMGLTRLQLKNGAIKNDVDYYAIIKHCPTCKEFME